jgi:hypothetical protein
MKNLIILFALFLGLSVASYAEFNPVVPSDNVTLTSKVIAPLLITPVTTNTIHLLQVIKGETRTYGPNDQSYIVFNCSRENERKVQFHLNFIVWGTALGTKLNATWIVMANGIDYADMSIIPGAQNPLVPYSGDWYWDITENGHPADPDQIQMKLRVDAIDATGASGPGTDIFTAQMEAWYINL